MADQIETDDKRARIEALISGGAWQIAPDREQTCRAPIDCLAAMPAALVELIFAANRLIVAAPSRKHDALTYAFRFRSSVEAVETCLVFSTSG